MSKFRELVTVNLGTPNEHEADITLTANTPADVIVDQMGVLSVVYDQAMTAYLQDVAEQAKSHALAGRRRGAWEATEQVHIADAKRRVEGRGPSLDALKGDAKKQNRTEFTALLNAEEDAAAREIVVRALWMKIDMIRTKVMMRQSALSAATDREKSAKYSRGGK